MLGPKSYLWTWASCDNRNVAGTYNNVESPIGVPGFGSTPSPSLEENLNTLNVIAILNFCSLVSAS
jgi:hypothetical protein